MATTRDGVVPKREPRIAATCNKHAMGRKFLEDKLGFMVGSKPLFAADVANGKLVLLLPNVHLQSVDVIAIFPANCPKIVITRPLIDFFKERIVSTMGSG